MKTRPRKANRSATLATKKPSAKKPDDFASVARRLECDDDKAAFEKKLGKIAKAKPKTEGADRHRPRS